MPISRGTWATSHWTRLVRPPREGVLQVSRVGIGAQCRKVTRAQYQALTAQKTTAG